MISTDEFGNFYQSVEMEQCVFGKSVVEIPQEFCEKVDLFSEVLNLETWEKVLNDEQRNHLMKFLPTFQENDDEEKNATIKNLFTGENFRFGNPIHQFHRRLKDGYYSPETVTVTALLRKAIYREYRYQQQRYFYKLLQDILISRKKLLEAASKLPPDQPVRMERIQPRYGNNSVDQKTKRRYFRELQEIREEVSYLETSSEDENYPEGSPPKMTKRQKKQLFHLEAALSPDMARVTSTLHPKCNSTDNGNNTVPSMRSVSPFEVSEEDYREMLLRHKRRRAEIEDHPELDTEGIALQDVVLRTNMTKRSAPRPVSAAELSSKKKCKDKEKIQNKKKKVKPPSSPVLLDELTKQVELDMERATPLMDIKDIKIEMDLIKEDDGNSLPPRSSTPNLLQDTFLSFFSLIRDLFCRSPEQRMSTQKLEDEVRAWQEGPFGGLNEWYMLQVNWPDQVFSALKFLAGELSGIMVENFVPYIDYKEKCQMWQWIGAGRDSDENMAALCKAWLDNKDDIPITEALDMVPGSPPPPRIHTEWVVRSTTEEEKAIYREQERRRYEMPHRAFTFRMHNYESVVGPVKGVYGKESAVNKAREHSLLVSDRPSFVTILSLVRDSAARLPNGEGTRADICELLKDSQYLAPASDSQIHTVVSGALDRLHYEKDPCVKYDVNRKLWIYLHRNRTEEEFERIHQAHAAAAKAKKADKKTKVPRSKSKEVPRPVASQSPASSDSALSLDMTSITGGSTSAVSPATAQSPRGGSSPRAQQTSPKVSASASKIMSSAQNNTKVHVASTGTNFMPPSNSKTVTASITASQITQRLGNSALLTCNQAISRPPSTESVPSPQLSTTAPFVLPQSHAGSRPSSTGSAQSLPSPKAVIANVNAAQFVSVSQVQITPGTVSPKTVISPSTHTSQAKTVSNLLNQQQAFQQIVAKQQAINKPTVAVVTSPSIAQSVSTVKLLPSQSVILGKPGTNPLVSQPIGQPTLQGLQTIMIKQEPGTQMVTTQSGGTSSPKTVLTPGTKPVVARIISNPQVVSVGNLINTLTQKQGATLPGATTFKIQGGNIVRPMGGKPGQMNVIQTTPGAGGLSRLAVVSQGGTGNLIPVSCATVSTQPKLVAASGQIGVMHSQLANQQAQLSTTSKSAILTTQGGMKIISTSATSPGVNLAHLGKPGQTVVVTTKPATPTSVAVATTTAAQNVILTSGGQTSPAVVIATQGALKPAQTVVMAAAGTAQTVVMAAQPGIRPITATAVTPMNMKALQGVKVIPVSQGAGAKGKAQPVFARIITPPAGLTLRPTGAVTSTQQGISVIQSVAAIPSGAATVRSGTPGMATSIPSTQAAIIRLQTPSNAAHIDIQKENT